MLTIRVLATDLDNTLAGVAANRKGKVPEYLLMPSIINRVKEEKYQVCYGLTSRRTQDIVSVMKDQVLMYDRFKAISTQPEDLDFSGIDPCDCFTTKIVDNFHKLTGLPMSKVSTPDDLGYECGSGYEQNIKGIEKALLDKKKSVTETRIFVRQKGKNTLYLEKRLRLDYEQLPDFKDIEKIKIDGVSLPFLVHNVSRQS